MSTDMKVVIGWSGVLFVVQIAQKESLLKYTKNKKDLCEKSSGKCRYYTRIWKNCCNI